MGKNSFINAVDSLSFLVKVVLCLPVLDLVWAIYRIIKGYTAKDYLMLLVGILWIVPGAAFLWIIDIVCMLLNKKLLFA